MAREGDDFKGAAYALLVGVKDFSDPNYAKHPLVHAVEDADGLAGTLTSRLKWDPLHLKRLTGSVTKSEIVRAFHCIREQASGGARLFLFYLSTHGHPFRDRGKDDAVLLTTDTTLTDTLAILESGITRQFLGMYVGNVPATQRVVILDACFSASAVSPSDIAPQGFAAEVDAAVLASSPRIAYAFPDDRYSVFTGCLLRGIGKDPASRKLGSAVTTSPRPSANWLGYWSQGRLSGRIRGGTHSS